MIAAIAIPQGAAGAAYEKAASTILCDCGCHPQSVKECACSRAEEMRQAIATEAASGTGGDAIVAGYVARYGQKILISPEASEEHEILDRGQIVVQQRLVGDHADPAARRGGARGLSRDGDRAAARADGAREQPEQRRLPGAVPAEHRDRLAGADVEIDAGDGGACPEPPRQGADREQHPVGESAYARSRAAGRASMRFIRSTARCSRAALISA